MVTRRKFILNSASAITALGIMSAAPKFAFASAPTSGRIKNIIRVFLNGGADSLYLFPFVDGPISPILTSLRPTLQPSALNAALFPSGHDQSGRANNVAFHTSWKVLVDKLTETNCGSSIICEYGVTKDTSGSHEVATQNFNLGTTNVGGQTTKGFIGRLVDSTLMDPFSVWGFGVPGDSRIFAADTNRPVVISRLANFKYTERNFGSMTCDGLGNCPKTGDKTSSAADDSAYARSISQRLLSEVAHPEIALDKQLEGQLAEVSPAVSVVQDRVAKVTLGTGVYGAGSVGSNFADMTRAVIYTNSSAAPESLRNGAKMFFTSYGGWDSHSGQAGYIPAQIAGAAQALAGLVHNLNTAGLLNQTIIIVESEFGRTTKENGSTGTDHAAGGKALVLGGLVRKAVLGPNPNVALASTTNHFQPQVSFTGIWKQLLTEAGFTKEHLAQAFPMAFPGEDPLQLFM